jgi:hypothetical protein
VLLALEHLEHDMTATLWALLLPDLFAAVNTYCTGHRWRCAREEFGNLIRGQIEISARAIVVLGVLPDIDAIDRAGACAVACRRLLLLPARVASENE